MIVDEQLTDSDPSNVTSNAVLTGSKPHHESGLST